MTTASPPPRDRPPVVRWVGSGIWLIYLEGPATRLVALAPGWERTVGLACLVLFAVTYLVAVNRVGGFRPDFDVRDGLAVRWAFLAVMLACVAGIVPGAGDEALTCMVFVAAAATGSLPLRQGWAVVFSAFAVTEIAGRLVPGWSDNGNGFAVLLAGLAVFAFRMALVRQRQLVAAERELGEARLEEERSRIARDLHDILGHSLTVITVKSELASRLVESDPGRCRSELDDLQRLSRDALADVRSTAHGIRGVSLAGEIAEARTVLESAGIEAALPTVLDEVPTRWRELFAWTVREGVTNVVRHSGASRCWVEIAPDGLTVGDDGRGAPVPGGGGRGLDGLGERAFLAGATMTAGPAPDGGFRIHVAVNDE